MKYNRLFVCLMLLFVSSGVINGQNALSIDQNEANFGKINRNFHGWVKSVKQRFYPVASKKYADEMTKEGRDPIYQINVYYTKTGDVARVEGPGPQVITYQYNANGDISLIDPRSAAFATPSLLSLQFVIV